MYPSRAGRIKVIRRGERTVSRRFLSLRRGIHLYGVLRRTSRTGRPPRSHPARPIGPHPTGPEVTHASTAHSGHSAASHASGSHAHPSAHPHGGATSPHAVPAHHLPGPGLLIRRQHGDGIALIGGELLAQAPGFGAHALASLGSRGRVARGRWAAQPHARGVHPG